MRRILPFMLLFVSAWLTSCQTPQPPEAPSLTFNRYQPMHLDVAHIEVIDEYKPPMHAPYIEHLVPISPSEAMHLWVRDRLRATGTDRTLQVIIKDASIKATILPRPEGVQGFFKGDDKRYDAKLVVEMRVYGEGAMSEASLEVTVTRSITTAVNASVADRQETLRRMVFSMMDSANAELERNIFKYFGRYISYSQNP